MCKKKKINISVVARRLFRKGETTELYRKGNEYCEMGDFEKALECYDRLLLLNNTDKAAWHKKGEALMELGLYDRVISFMDPVP